MGSNRGVKAGAISLFIMIGILRLLLFQVIESRAVFAPEYVFGGLSDLFDVYVVITGTFRIDEIDITQKFKESQIAGFVLIVDFAIRDAGFGFVYVCDRSGSGFQCY